MNIWILVGIVFVIAVIMTIFFGKRKIVDWRLVLVIGSMTSFSAFLGSFYSDRFNATLLKIIFAI